MMVAFPGVNSNLPLEIDKSFLRRFGNPRSARRDVAQALLLHGAGEEKGLRRTHFAGMEEFGVARQAAVRETEVQTG